jgi:FkbM family methyltransferase
METLSVGERRAEPTAMDTIFDIGMFDGSDTAYYLETGHRVVAVEANPDLVEQARRRFDAAIAAGRLICVHAAVTADGAPVELMLAGSDLGSSSLFADKVARKRPAGAVEVPGVTIAALIREHGTPKYLKVDIEGADRYCVLALERAIRPRYLSFEIGEDVDELLAHCASVGYERFKIIHQNSFREASRVECLYDRAARRIMRTLGYAEPTEIRRAGRFFLAGHSSGPVPWQSDGAWQTLEATRSRLRGPKLPGWCDIHATVAS